MFIVYVDRAPWASDDGGGERREALLDHDPVHSALLPLVARRDRVKRAVSRCVVVDRDLLRWVPRSARNATGF